MFSRFASKSLKTSVKSVARSHALLLASKVLKLSHDLRTRMATKPSDDTTQVSYKVEISLDGLGQATKIVLDAKPEETEAANLAVSNALEGLDMHSFHRVFGIPQGPIH
jgi:hypothetical protein